ncbi:D-2-hydroxyacid dehydrogenase [Chelatococcus asaccharovorans]|uniref:Phosphoglycerate dehydrogenase-like enzyme n=1 Tax=Chelatococcus asaccharovorans TaxID=28210 RepID=A0A2V3UEW2_9HYPH|nr:D-2-hydroxyacid dehydrogenase [Chelatococcus asaccharovorans]MBS7707420.1 D-2-hydroxyacid dehydrogenase [Chelatococcus asaccharovorans]PXW63600.1 phosphoglycerate dehydrogenase-like enzyme [Chelatococcus asaccharovorans]
MKAALLTSIARDSIAASLAPFGDVRLVADVQDLHQAIDGADALVMSNPGLYTAEFADELCRHGGALKWIQFLSAGYDGARLHGIPAGTVLTNAGECWSPTVAEHAVMLLLALVRRLTDCHQAQDERRWDAGIRPRLSSLEGKTVTVLGFGSIGRDIATRLRPFGAHVVGVTRSGKPAEAGPAPDRMAAVGELDRLLPESDALIVTLPLSQETRHIIDADRLARLPAHAVLVNVSRGGTVDGVALAEALKAGRLGGAALDVTEPEPLPATDPLWTTPNTIITPHIAGFGSGALDGRLAALVAENASRFAAGRALLHRVDVPVRPATAGGQHRDPA